jgi:hypothetical protein
MDTTHKGIEENEYGRHKKHNQTSPTGFEGASKLTKGNSVHILGQNIRGAHSSRNIKFVSFARPLRSGKMILFNLTNCLDKPVGSFNTCHNSGAKRRFAIAQ